MPKIGADDMKIIHQPVDFLELMFIKDQEYV